MCGMQVFVTWSTACKKLIHTQERTHAVVNQNHTKEHRMSQGCPHTSMAGSSWHGRSEMKDRLDVPQEIPQQLLPLHRVDASKSDTLAHNSGQANPLCGVAKKLVVVRRKHCVPRQCVPNRRMLRKQMLKHHSTQRFVCLK